MLEHLSLDRQPAIGVSNKTIAVFDWRGNFEVQVREMVCLSCCNCFYFPLVRPGHWNTDHSLHLMPLPMYQEKSVTLALQPCNLPDLGKISDSARIIT